MIQCSLFGGVVVNCKKCKKENIIKNGFVRGKQRYRCKDCQYNFVEGDLRIKQENVVKRALAVLLYSMGRGTFNFIGKLLNVSHVSVYKWIRQEAEQINFPEIKNTIQEIEIDEMWHFIQSKKTNVGSLRPWIVVQGEPLAGLQAVVMLRPSESYIKK